MNRGYWKFWRKILDDHLIEQPHLLATWVYCMTQASHNEHTYPDGNNVGPGQLITSRAKVAVGTGQSEKQARLSLEKLQRGSKITLDGTRGRHTLITMSDWDLYQSAEDPRTMKGTNEGQMRANSGPFEGRSRAITNHSHSNTHSHTEGRRRATPDGVAALSSQVVEYLNQKTEQDYRTSAKTTQELIAVRLNEGYTFEDMKSVIDSKTAAWLSSPEMVTNLKPNTLFKMTNFESYLGGRTTPEDTASKEREMAMAATEIEKERRRRFDEVEEVPWYELLDIIQEEAEPHYSAIDEQSAMPLLRALLERGYKTNELKQLIQISTDAWKANECTERIGLPSWYFRADSVLSWLTWSEKKGYPVPDVGRRQLKEKAKNEK